MIIIDAVMSETQKTTEAARLLVTAKRDTESSDNKIKEITSKALDRAIKLNPNFAEAYYQRALKGTYGLDFYDIKLSELKTVRK